MQLFNQISWYLFQEWKRYLGSIALLIIIAILQLLPPKLVGFLIDTISTNKKYHYKLFYWLVLIFLTSIIIYIFRYMWRVLLFGASYKLAIILRKKLYLSLSQKNSSFYDKYRTGDLMARATNDIDKIVFAAGEGVLTLIDSMITGISVLIIMVIQINWKLTLISLLPMPIMAIIITKYGKKLYIAFQKSQQSFSNLNNQTQENIKNIYTVKSFGLEKYEIKKFKEILSETSKKSIIVSKIDAKFDPIIYFSITVSNLLSITTGSYLVWNNNITIGQLTSFIMYLSLMVWPMLALAWMFNIVERGSASWSRVNEIISENNIKQMKNKKILHHKSNIKIKISSFQYPNTKNIILKNISQKIKFNNIVGICGPTGQGKTTLINLIQRNFKIKKGQIFYHNVLISNFKIHSWRKKISTVNEKTFLFSDTIANNISFGNINITKKKIEYVSSLVNIHHEIIKFPKQYDTKVGAKGIILSGGQKQRIAIARALLMNREILILDNALSALDKPTQNMIFNNIILWKKQNHTIIIVSHELHIFKKINNIFIIQNGTIKDSGTHDELIKYQNWYSKMYHQQQQK
ncbi:ABC transporter transmembrane domain-containing protein [Buchnera aphidicola]|uniref:ABC transporter transmembrane domain-containing protein n=1 Tax=Buchnera aphidicola TaxID=9 RepID=UPI0034640821